jgi:hypothetical protein
MQKEEFTSTNKNTSPTNVEAVADEDTKVVANAPLSNDSSSPIVLNGI